MVSYTLVERTTGRLNLNVMKPIPIQPNRKDFRRLRDEHSRRLRDGITAFRGRGDGEVDCMHEQCTSCFGTGVKEDGTACIHFISCSCPKCTPRM